MSTVYRHVQNGANRQGNIVSNPFMHEKTNNQICGFLCWYVGSTNNDLTCDFTTHVYAHNTVVYVLAHLHMHIVQNKLVFLW